jgi:glutamate synthase domain-containing protein 1
MKTERKLKRNYEVDLKQDRILSNCGLTGFICEDGKRTGGADIINSISVLHDRGNGLGGGFAAYGIYPDLKDFYAIHLMFDDACDKEDTECLLKQNCIIEQDEEIPTKRTPQIIDPPILWRYFVKPGEGVLEKSELGEEDFIVKLVMQINTQIKGAFVVSSGKNMGAFKAVGFPEDIGVFFRLDEYKAWTWIAHSRFPTNTPGWWGGAHPFTILDWAIVHNGEISSYGINKRYLEMFGYQCTMMTDTEVTAYLFDLLLRKHGLPIEVAALVFAAPFWTQIERMPQQKRELVEALRIVYGPALINGPFAVLLGHKGGLIGLNDRIKLRPLVCARKDDVLYMASEESGIREICPSPDSVWAPKAGDPVVGRLKEGVA